MIRRPFYTIRFHYSRAQSGPWQGFPWLTFSVKIDNFLYKSCLLHVLLTHWGRVTHICVSKLTIICSDNGLSPAAWSAPSHYLNQCWDIVNWTLGNKLQWNHNRNLYIFIQENTQKNVVWEMAAILSRPQCVNSAIAQYFLSKLAHMHLCGIHYQGLWPNCCK